MSALRTWIDAAHLTSSTILRALDWSLGMAIDGAVVVTGSAVLALLANRAADPRLTVATSGGDGVFGKADSMRLIVAVEVTNIGRGDVTMRSGSNPPDRHIAGRPLSASMRIGGPLIPDSLPNYRIGSRQVFPTFEFVTSGVPVPREVYGPYTSQS